MKKVFIVDDTKNIRLLLTKCLTLEGYEVRSAADGKEALEILSKESFDLIFLDIKLPEISGTEVLRQLRAKGIKTPVIIITAYATIKNAVECTRLGVISYLKKPFTADRLKAILQELDPPHSNKKFPDLPVTEEASLLIEGGQIAKAISTLQSALSENPQDSRIYDLLADAYAALGNSEKSEKFRKAADIFR